MALACPPERGALHQLIDLELGTGAVALVETQRAAILLEQRVDARQPAVPAVLQVLQCQATVLLLRLEALLRVFGPYAL